MQPRLYPQWLVWGFILLILVQLVNKWMTQQPRWVGEPLEAGLLININTADEMLLAGLPGVGPSIAQLAIDYRQTHGPFTHPDDFINVKGIGPAKMVLIKPYIIVEPYEAPAASKPTPHLASPSADAFMEESEPLPAAMSAP